MNKLDFFLEAVKAKAPERKDWVLSAFATILEGPDDYLKDPYPYRIVKTPSNYSFINQQGKLEKIDDAKVNDNLEPLFKFKDRIALKAETFPNLHQDTETCLGNVLFNSLVILSSLGSKYPFPLGKIDLGAIDDKIASELQDDPEEGQEKNPNSYYVSELILYNDAIKYIEGWDNIAIVASTKVTMTAPKGLAEFKASLLKKYEGQLDNPVIYAQFEKELQAFDEEHLKNDPTNGVFLSGKVKNISRKKRVLTLGSESGFETKQSVKPVTNSLQEGWPTDPEQYVSMMNGLRYGSFMRGKDTVKGGVTAKIVLRATQSLKIVPGDCGTPLGLKFSSFPGYLSAILVGTQIQKNNVWVWVEKIEEARSYIGKEVILRSPQYCFSEGDGYCECCMGKKLSVNPDGIRTAATEVSAVVLSTSMAAMHGKVLETQFIDLDEVMS